MGSDQSVCIPKLVNVIAGQSRVALQVESWELTLPWEPMSISWYLEPQPELLQLTEMHGPLGEMFSLFDTECEVCRTER